MYNKDFLKEEKSYTEETFEKEVPELEEKLWYKLERTSKKISFANDIIALIRYLTDKNIAWYRKTIIIAALIYFLAPIDSIPDIAPLIGYLDDLGVITATLKFLGKELIPYYES